MVESFPGQGFAYAQCWRRRKEVSSGQLAARVWVVDAPVIGVWLARAAPPQARDDAPSGLWRRLAS
jgi:hypothetical protein